MLKDKHKSKYGIFKYPKAIFCISLTISFIISVVTVRQIQADNLSLEKAKASKVASDYVSSLEKIINNNLSLNYTLGMLVHEWEGKVDKFEKLADQVLPLYPSISNVSLAPNGIVQKIIPLKGNEGAVGHDLFADKNRSTEAIETKKSGVLTVAGPYHLIQGTGYAIIGRLPIFLSNEKGDEDFWGFTSTVMLIEVILKEANIESLKDLNYEYELWRINPDTSEKEILSSSKSYEIESEEQEITVPNGKWIMGISPIGGWHSKSKLYTNIFISLVLDILISSLLYTVTKLKLSEISLEEIAFFDQLTGLPNRRLFFDRIQQAMEHSKREGKLLAVCYMDLDDFKDINDTWGHKAGDYVLKEAGRRCKDTIRKIDTIARLGGDEFAFLLTDLKDKKECILILDRIKAAIRQPVIFEENTINISISIGVTIYPEDDSNDETLLRHADVALYKIKEQNKGQYGFYNAKEYLT